MASLTLNENAESAGILGREFCKLSRYFNLEKFSMGV